LTVPFHLCSSCSFFTSCFFSTSTRCTSASKYYEDKSENIHFSIDLDFILDINLSFCIGLNLVTVGYVFSLVSHSIPKLIILKKNNITYSTEYSNNRPIKSSHIIFHLRLSPHNHTFRPVGLFIILHKDQTSNNFKENR
jgi:hypothetical protein